METKLDDSTILRRLLSLVVGSTPHLFPLRPVVDGDRITYHKHWFVLVRSVLVPVLAFAVAALLLLGIVATPNVGDSPILKGFGLVLAAFSLLWLLWRYDDWRNDFYVVGKDRIVDVDRLPLGLRTEVREAPLGNVQNLSLRIPHFIAAFFDYGDVMVDTAGKQGQLVFESVARPREVLAEISARVEGYRSERVTKEREQRDREMLQWFSAYAELGRIVVLRNPHTLRGGEPVEVEWRIAGSPASVECCLKWDVEERPERDYRFSTVLQTGGVGNYGASFAAPPGEKVCFAIYARIDGADHWSLPHVVNPIV